VEPLEAVRRNMQRLSLLSKYIRAAIPWLQLQQFKDKMDGLNEWQTFVENLIRWRHRQLGVSRFLVERLVATVVIPRIRFKYLQSHYRKLYSVSQQRPVPEAKVEVRLEPTTTTKFIDSLAPTTAATIISSYSFRPNPSSMESIPEPPPLQTVDSTFTCLFCMKALPAISQVSTKWG
jgi:hypothetical protein